ncbi:hypothetical protein GPECTOR_47g335 [Gonium pectorale]|uniref:Uncharacterized protein n=1 Tax=Gonium pectorale TaxID=33097 RepID=A0A150G9N4_GONPE|nr:hypothetical protein GPECTOR_47g335 [Gonium pectorale]|eukprot:KXZ46060.1 hypothetical protein GPECTOR_47g335 [Gonium pectorale]
MVQQQPAANPMPHHWSFRVWPQLLPELAERIVDGLSHNEVSGTLRHLNKATSEHFSGPQHTTIQLSEPVPPHAFAAQWLTPGATRGLKLDQRRKLVCLVAASGVLPNMEVALQAAGFVGAVAAAFMAAAGAGQLPMCQWLWGYSSSCAGTPLDAYSAEDALNAAAGGGHRHVCEWLLVADFDALRERTMYAALRGGHADLAEWLLQSDPTLIGSTYVYLCNVAHGCDLPSLKRAWLRFGPSLGLDRKAAVLNYAAGSPMPGWAAKVEWLEAQGCTYSPDAAVYAAVQPDHGEALTRLTWLLEKRHGHLHVLAWLLDTLGPAAVVLNAELFAAAAKSGNMELLAWLRQRGCAWDFGAYSGAAEAGWVAALEWLAEQGCPMEESGQPYINACRNGDLATLRCLRRLGVPWGPDDGSVFLAAAKGHTHMGAAQLPLLRWLLEEGCPVDNEAVEEEVEDEEVLRLVREHLAFGSPSSARDDG